MTKKKEKSNVTTKEQTKKVLLPRAVVYLPGAEKEIESLSLELQIRLKSIIHIRLAHDLNPGVEVERLDGKAKGWKLNELKIKSTESVRCFYSLQDSSVLVTVVFLKKRDGQATKEIDLAVQRLKDYGLQKKK